MRRMASEIDDTWQKLGVKICSVCQFKASDDGVFQSHICRRKKNQIVIRFKKQLDVFVCSTCKIEQNKSDFTEHLQCHLQEKPFVCSYCDKDFESKYGVYGHFRLVHPSMPKSYSLKIDEDTERYLKLAKKNPFIFINSVRSKVSLDPQTAAMQEVMQKGSPPKSHSSIGSSRSTTAQCLKSQSPNDVHTRSVHTSRDSALSSESPETPQKHPTSSSYSKDTHNSTITSSSLFAKDLLQISAPSIVPEVTLLSKVGKPILNAKLSCPTVTNNPPVNSFLHNYTSPAISTTATFSNEGHAPQKASIPSENRISQSHCNNQTLEPPIISSTIQFQTKKSCSSRSTTAQCLKSQSPNDVHTRSVHPSRDSVFSSEPPETPQKHPISSSHSKDIHNSTITSSSLFAKDILQISAPSIVPEVTLLSKVGTPILNAKLSCPTVTNNPPVTSCLHNYTSPAISTTATYSNEGHAPQKASIPPENRISQSHFNNQTLEPPIISSTIQFETKKQHAPVKVSIPHGNKVFQSYSYPQTSLSPATKVLNQPNNDSSSNQNSSFSSRDRVSHSCSNFQTSSAVVLTTQPSKAIHTSEKSPCPERGIKSQPVVGPQTSLPSVYNVTIQHSKDGHTSVMPASQLDDASANSLNQSKSVHSFVNLFKIQPSMPTNTSAFVPIRPSPSVEIAPQSRANSQKLIPLVFIVPHVTTPWPARQTRSTTSMPPAVFSTNQSSKGMSNLAPHPRPCGDKVSQSVQSSSRAVLPPSIHLNNRASREIPTLAKSLYVAKDNTAQSCVVKSVSQAPLTHAKVGILPQNSPLPTERLSSNEQRMQNVQPGNIDLSIVKTDCDPVSKQHVEKEKLAKDLDYSFLNIFCVSNEKFFVCSKCRVKFKEREPFFHHIWKKHAHTSSDSQCCTSSFNESCLHLQRIVKFLNNKAMGLFDGLFNIKLEQNQLSVCTSEVLPSMEDEKVSLSSVLQKPQLPLTSIDSGSCQPILSKCLEILNGNPNCITQLQTKVEEIDNEISVRDNSLTNSLSANEVPTKAREVGKENGSSDILEVCIHSINNEKAEVITNPLNQMCDIVTGDLKPVNICEGKPGSSITLSKENLVNQNLRVPENHLNGGKEGSNLTIHLQQSDQIVGCSVTAKPKDPTNRALEVQIQMNEEKTNEDSNKAEMIFNVRVKKTKLSTCTGDILPPAEDEVPLLSPQQQPLLPPTSLIGGSSICQPKLSECLDILTEDPNCITQLQSTVEKMDVKKGSEEDSLTGLSSTNEVQSKAREECKESGAGEILDVHNLEVKEFELIVNPLNQLHDPVINDVNAVKICEENISINTLSKNCQSHGNKASKNLVSGKDVNKSKEIANPLIGFQKDDHIVECSVTAKSIDPTNNKHSIDLTALFRKNEEAKKSDTIADTTTAHAPDDKCSVKGLITDRMTKCFTTENEMPVSENDEDKGNPEVGHEIGIEKSDKNGKNSSVTLCKHSSSKLQMKVKEMSSKNSQDDSLPVYRDTNDASYFYEQFKSDIEINRRGSKEENSEPDVQGLVIQEVDEEKGQPVSSVEVLQQSSVKVSTDTEEPNCRNDRENVSNMAQIGKGLSSVMITATHLPSGASNSEKDHIKTTESNDGSSESECVQKSTKALEQINDNSKCASLEQNMMVSENSNSILSNFFKCAFSHCDFTSCLPVDLLTHNQEIHGMECIFSCFYCGFEAKSTSQLLHHMDFHLDLTCDSYSGTIWKKSFTEKILEVTDKVLGTAMNALECESRSIENVGYSCNLCEMSFTSLKALGCHFEESTLRTYSCRYCRAHFLDSKSAEKHIREEHPKVPLFRRQHRKLLCKDRMLNKESFSKLHKKGKKVVPKSQENFLKRSPSNSIECLSQTVAGNKLTEMVTNKVHVNNDNVAGELCATERNGSKGNERKEDMSVSQTMISSSHPLLSCADEPKSNLTVRCHAPQQLETANEIGPNHYNPATKDDYSVFADDKNSSFAIRESVLFGSVASESVLTDDKLSPIAFRESSGSAAINTNSDSLLQTAGPEKRVATAKEKKFKSLEKLSTPDFAVSNFSSTKPKKMPRIYDLCAEKSTADCLSSLYSQIQDGLYSCNSCRKNFQRLRSMLCHIFFCQGKISVVNCPYNCTFESEHPKTIIKHIEEKHPKKDPKCKSFRCINVCMFFQFLKDKEVNQIVLEKACKMQNGHTTGMKTFRRKTKINTSKDKREAISFQQSSLDSEVHEKSHDYSDDENCAFAGSQNGKRQKVTESAEVYENKDYVEMKVPGIKKRSHGMSSPRKEQNKSDDMSQSKIIKLSLAVENAETKCFKESSEVNNVETEEEIKSIHKSNNTVEAELQDKTKSAISVSEKQGLETDKNELQLDPPVKDINSAASKLMFDKNSLYQCQLCHLVLNFDIDHMMKHISEQHIFFACGYCERPYHDLAILKNHIRFSHNKSPPKFQQISPELIFTRADSTLSEKSHDNVPSSQNEENREMSFGNRTSPPTPLLKHPSENVDTTSPKTICKDFPDESSEKDKEKDGHPASATSSVLKANDLNCQHLGETYFGFNHGKDAKGSEKGAHDSCSTSDFTTYTHSLQRPSSLWKQTLDDKKPKSIESKEIDKNFKENSSQIIAQEQSPKTHTSQPEQNPTTSFPGSKDISLKRKADEILSDDFLYNEQQHMKRPCCGKLVHKDTWEMETRCGADLSLAYSQPTNLYQSMETSPEKALEAKDHTSQGVQQTIDSSSGYAYGVNNPRSGYSNESRESCPEYVLEDKNPSPEYVYKTKEPSHEDINVSFCAAHEAVDNFILKQQSLNINFTTGEGLKDKRMGQPFFCTGCMISLPSVSEMKMHFAFEHFNEKIQWFEQRMGFDYSSDGEKFYHKTDLRPSVTKYLCGYCIFQSPMKESISKHMASAHNSMEYHFLLPTTEGDPVAYTERCCITEEGEAGIACKHEMLTTERSGSKLHYGCHLCGAYLNSEFLFRLHLAKHGGFKHCSTLSSTRGLLFCATCGYVASSCHDLASHVDRHMTERRYSCSCCGFDDHKRKGVLLHIKKYHGDGSSAYAVDNERQNKDVDIRPKLVDLNPIVSVTRYL